MSTIELTVRHAIAPDALLTTLQALLDLPEIRRHVEVDAWRHHPEAHRHAARIHGPHIRDGIIAVDRAQFTLKADLSGLAALAPDRVKAELLRHLTEHLRSLSLRGPHA